MTLREVNRVGEGQKNVPKLRFKGYEDAWEQRKLGDIADKVTVKNSNLQYIETFTNSAEVGIISQRDYFDHDIANLSNLDGYYIVQKEDFVYNPRISTSAPVGPINRNKLGRVGVMSPLYTVFRTHNVDTTYLEYFFKSQYWHSFMKFHGDSGARSDRFSIKDAIFFKMPIPLPDIDEQQKIGDYLNSVDHLITLHQRKYDALKTMKKTLLSKMFPKDGEDVPEIRFKGFTDAWEQRMLPDFVEFYNGQTYTPADVQEFGTLVLRSSNIRNGEVIDADNVYINSEKATAEQVKEGDIIVVVRNGSRALIGKHAEIKENMPNTVIGAFMTGLRSGQPSFLNALLETTQFEQEIEKNMGATINQITGYMFSKMSFMTTGENEQEAVGNYFKEIDNLITLHQRKLDELKNIKKTLLQQMFV